MLKFKMSLLLRSVKFRVAIVALVIATILAGVVLIPMNKAAEISNEVTVVANNSGASANGIKFYEIKKTGNEKGYDTLFCIEEGASLSSKTYSNPIEISNGSDYFKYYNCAMWVINNMYTTSATGENGLSNDEAKDVIALNLANLLTSDKAKEKVIKRGLDVSGITTKKIYDLRNKTINGSSNVNAFEFAEQLVLWKYTNNIETGFFDAYHENVNQFLDGSTLTPDEQITLKYVMYAYGALADMKRDTPSSNTITDYVVLKKDEAKVDTTNYKVGPYYLESNGFRLTGYGFGEFQNGLLPVTATITKSDGSTVTAGAEVFIKNDDGSFYIDLANYKDAQKVDFKIDGVLSTVNTQAHVLDGGNKQNLLTVNKSVGKTSLGDSKTISVPSQYNIVLKKVKKDGTTVITSSEATFTINGQEQQTQQGILNIEQGKSIANTEQVDSYEIAETKAPEGFVKVNGTAKLTVKFKQNGNTYAIDEEQTTLEGTEDMQNAKLQISDDKTTINIYVPNDEKEGTYNVVLKKVKKDGTTVITSSEATFKINDQEQNTTQGILNIAEGKTIADEKQNDVYTIEETKAPEGFVKINGTAKLSVKFKLDGKNYLIDNENTTLEGTDQMKNAKLEVSDDKKTITIYVPNEEKEGKYNVVLKKVKKDGTTVITSSEATFKINGKEQNTTKGILNIAEGKTIADEKQNDVYTIEETKAPEGFVKINGTAKLSVKFKLDGKNYLIDNENTTLEGTDQMKNAKLEVSDDKKTITIYVPNEEKEGKYNVVLKKVKKDGTTVITSSEATFKINGKEQNTTKGILNIAEGKTIADEKQNDVYTIEETKAPEGFVKINGTAKLSVKFKLDGKNYLIDNENTTLEGTDQMKNAKLEVSDDKKTITIYVPNEEKEGKYNVVLKKVKKDGTTVITSSEATFKINGKEQNTTKGILNIAEGKTIDNEEQNDIYTIEETKAPEGFIKINGEAKLSVKFKLEGNKYLIDNEKTTLNGTEQMEDAKLEISEDNKTITIYVPNEESVKYNVELYKVDKDDNIIETPAKFEVNGKEETTNKGIVKIAKDVEVKDEETIGTYVIKELEAPENYVLFDKTVKVTVQMTRVDGKLTLTEDGIKLFIDPDDGKEKDDKSEESNPNVNDKVKVKLDGTTVKVYVVNDKKEFDLSLRKFISKINGKEVKPSREPIINEESIKILQKTGTAAYFHTKDSVGVNVGDEIEYTIRVYNEGEILGFAKQITDYLPDGLSFVKLSDDNSKEYTTKTEAGSKVVVIDYSGNTTIKTLRDFFGKKDVKVTDDYYQEVKIICKVEDTDKTYITNRGEITNYGYSEKDEEGNTVWKEAKVVGETDRDSAQDTIKDDLNLDTWYEDAKEYTYTDEDGKDVTVEDYYPGAQDDDDFETVEVLKGQYKVVIRKVDSSDRTTTLEGAYFSIKGSGLEKETEVGPTGSDGEVVLVDNVKIINDKQVDKYTIKETKAPVDYAVYQGNIVIEIGTKLKNGILVIDEDNIKIDQKDIDFTVNENGTLITIIIPDEKKEFDLSLRKFITEVNDEKLKESREPQVEDLDKLASGDTKTATYKHSKEPVDVNTKDVVTYTIRVYNEGEISGYASRIMDDIPEGLELIAAEYDKDGKPLNTNAEYKWVAYREMAENEVGIPENVITYDNKSYIVTEDVKNADLIVTDYLSKENGEDNLIKAYDPNTMKALDYKDVKVSFKVIEPTTSDRVITNYAQITNDTDSNGKAVTDRDSTPNEWNEGEDDQDTEKVKVRFFDLSLRKWVTKAIVYENGYETVTETNHRPEDDPEEVVKVDLKNTSIDNVEVKFEYSIRVTNEGEIPGYAKEVSDYIPAGLKFVKEDNPQWTEVDGKIVTRALEDTLLQPGEYADVTVTLTWINGANNLGLKTNIAEISEDYNDWGTPDIDSTPNNQVFGEDDIDDAPVILAVRTGGTIVYTGIALLVLGILSTGAFVIKRKILR